MERFMWGDTLAGGNSGRGGIREITRFVGAAQGELPSQEFERTGTLEEHWWRRRKRLCPGVSPRTRKKKRGDTMLIRCDAAWRGVQSGSGSNLYIYIHTHLYIYIYIK